MPRKKKDPALQGKPLWPDRQNEKPSRKDERAVAKDDIDKLDRKYRGTNKDLAMGGKYI